jgi:hypothetical protein
MTENTYCHSVLGGYEGGWKESPTWSEDNSWTVSDKLSEEWRTVTPIVSESRPQGQAQQMELLTPRPQGQAQQMELLVCKTDNLKYIERLLILGTGQQNKYKSGISKISEEDLLLVQKEIDSTPNCYKLLDLVADIYLKGRAFKQDATMHVLALICRSKTNVALRRNGYELVGKLRTLSQLYLFLSFYTGGMPPLPPTKTKKYVKKVEKVSHIDPSSSS